MSVDGSLNPLGVIFGVEGYTLTDEEKAFFKKVNPLGFILFTRNIDNPDQIKELVSEMRDTVGREDAPVLIDQEGGRVARLRKPFWPELPPLKSLGDLKIDEAEKATELHAGLIASMLKNLSINVVCAPVLDVPIEGSHEVIGDRAFSNDPERVIHLGLIYIDTLLKHGITPVMKHIPGHGRADSDSHYECPVVEDSYGILDQTDFRTFRKVALKHQQKCWGMTAHVVFRHIDDDNPATVSSNVIGNVIRGQIGFNGFLLADDISMDALSGNIVERTKQAINAGCDALLHCNGKLEEMEMIVAALSPMSDISMSRYAESKNTGDISKEIDNSPLHERLNALYDMTDYSDNTDIAANHDFLDQ